MKTWREWFISTSEDADPADTETQVRAESGACDLDESLKLKRKMPPRCAKCKRFMGFEDGMYILISGDWRVHIRCFNEVLNRHFEQGEVIDLITGAIVIQKEEDEV